MAVRLYTRVSSASQVEAFSLAAQRTRGEAWAQFEGLGPVHVYEERGISGQRTDRPALSSLLADLQPGDVVLTYALSRLARGGVVQLLGLAEQIHNTGARLVSITEKVDTESTTGRLMFALLAALATMEIEITRERTSAGRIQAATEGVFPHNAESLPFGYTRADDGRIVAGPRADDLRLIFSLASGGTPYNAVASELNRRGIPTKVQRQEVKWTSSVVRRIVTNPIYTTGVFTYRQAAHPDTPADWIAIPAPVLVEPGVWQTAQRARTRNHPYRDPERYPLTGHLVCACGTPLVGSSNKPRTEGGAGYRYYTCRATIRDSKTCPATDRDNPSYPADQVEERARDALAQTLRTPAALALLAARDLLAPDPHAEERALLQERLSTLVDLHLEALIDRGEYTRRRGELAARLAALVTPLPEEPRDQPDLTAYADAVMTLPPEEYRALLGLLQVRWVVARKEVGVIHLSVPR